MSTSDREVLIEALARNRKVDTKMLHRRATELTRERLLLSAIESFSAKGYHNSNIRDIAKEAGVTRGAIYHHFNNKKDMFMSANRWRQDYTSEVLRERLAEEDDLFEGLRKAFFELFEILHTNEVIRGLVREYMAMAMIDPDVNQMHKDNDTELIDILNTELKRNFPTMSAKRRSGILERFYVSLEGMFTVLAVDSPIVSQPKKMLEGLINTFRKEILQ